MTNSLIGASNYLGKEQSSFVPAQTITNPLKGYSSDFIPATFDDVAGIWVMYYRSTIYYEEGVPNSDDCYINGISGDFHPTILGGCPHLAINDGVLYAIGGDTIDGYWMLGTSSIFDGVGSRLTHFRSTVTPASNIFEVQFIYTGSKKPKAQLVTAGVNDGCSVALNRYDFPTLPMATLVEPLLLGSCIGDKPLKQSGIATPTGIPEYLCDTVCPPGEKGLKPSCGIYKVNTVVDCNYNSIKIDIIKNTLTVPDKTLWDKLIKTIRNFIIEELVDRLVDVVLDEIYGVLLDAAIDFLGLVADELSELASRNKSFAFADQVATAITTVMQQSLLRIIPDFSFVVFKRWLKNEISKRIITELDRPRCRYDVTVTVGNLLCYDEESVDA